MKGRTWIFGIFAHLNWKELPVGVNYMVFAHRLVRDRTGTLGLVHFVQPVRFSGVRRSLGVPEGEEFQAETVNARSVSDKENFVMGYSDYTVLGRRSFLGPARLRPTVFFEPSTTSGAPQTQDEKDVLQVAACLSSEPPNWDGVPEDFKTMRRLIMEKKLDSVDRVVMSKYRAVMDQCL